MNKPPIVVDISYRYDKKSNDPISLLEKQSATSGHFSILAEKINLHVIRVVDKKTHFKSDKVNYHFVEGKNSKAWLPFQLHHFIRSLNPDVIIVHGFSNPLQILLLKFQTRANIVIQYHGGGAPFAITGFFQKLCGHFIRDYIFTAKEQTKEFVDKGIITRKSTIYEITEGSTKKTPLDKFKARQFLKIESETLILLWVGRLNKNKDPLTVLRGLQKILETNIDIKFFMIYQENDLLKEIKNFLLAYENLAKNVVLIGELPHDNLDYYYSSADYFVLGSHYESAGYALLEAMSCGCLPLVTNIPSFEKITDNGRLGVLWNAGDADSLAHAIEAIQQKDIKKESSEIVDYFQREHSFQAIAKRLYEMICKLTAGKN